MSYADLPVDVHNSALLLVSSYGTFVLPLFCTSFEFLHTMSTCPNESEHHGPWHIYGKLVRLLNVLLRHHDD